MTDLWAGAADSHEAMAHEARLALADAELETVMPFLLASRSDAEYVHRSALARGMIGSVAALCGLDEAELMATARRRFDLYRQALQEGQDPLAEVARDSQGGGYGSGPEKPDEHSGGPDLSHGYSEVPCGGSGGPSPAVTKVRPPAAQQVTEATGSLRRQAAGGPAMTPSYAPPMPPDTGTGAGSVDTGLPSAATGGMTPSLPAGGAAGSPAGPNTPVIPREVSQATASQDPVRRRVMAVTAAIRETNPHLPPAECERVARKVVGSYLVQGDLSSSVMDDQPAGQGSNGGGSSGSGGEGSGGLIQHGLEWQGLKSMIPGGGGVAGGAGLIGDAAELAAL